MAKPTPHEFAADARALDGNRWLEQFFDTHKRELVSEWETAASTLEREAIHAQVKAVNDLRGKLHAAIKKAIARAT